MSSVVEIRYDRAADAMYVTLTRDVAVVRSNQVDDGTLLDVDANGRPVGIEIIGPSRGWALSEIVKRYSLDDDDVATLRQVFGSPTVT